MVLRGSLFVLGLAAPPGSVEPEGPQLARSEPLSPAPAAALDRRQHRIQGAGMATLTAWGIANIVGGAVGNLTVPRGDPGRYFHQMNAMWNTVNLTLGIIGLHSVRRERGLVGHRDGVAASIAKTQRIFAINLLLDVAYMLGGYVTWELGRGRESPRLVGYGTSVIAQGAFLFVFDGAMILAHERGLLRHLPGYRVGAAPIAGGASLGLRGAF